MAPQTFENYANNFTQRDLIKSLRNDRNPPIIVPDKIHKSEVIKLALAWDEKYPEKAAAAYAVASARYIRLRRRLVAGDVAGDAKKALPAGLKTAIQLKLREWFAVWNDREPGVDNDPEHDHPVERELSALEEQAAAINVEELDEIIAAEEGRDG
jgi:hypothetical protein